MPKTNRSSQRKQVLRSKAKRSLKGTERETQILNSIINTTVILTSLLMGSFASAMTNAAGAMAAGMAGALGGDKAEAEVKAELKQKQPEIDDKMIAMVAEVRRDLYAQREQKQKEIGALISDSKFDLGPTIIAKYDFSLPKLTVELDDQALAQYTKLLVTGDPTFAEMFKELGDWMLSLQKLSEKKPKQR
jgi:hypothetical protein